MNDRFAARTRRSDTLLDLKLDALRASSPPSRRRPRSKPRSPRASAAQPRARRARASGGCRRSRSPPPSRS